MSVQIQLRNGTASAWTSANPTLASGEVGVETDTFKIKAGNGSLAWNSLSYIGGTPAGSSTQIQFNSGGSSFGGSANLTWDGTNVQLGATGALRFADTDSSNYVAFKAPGTVSANVTWTLPSTDGTSNQVLTTNGSGTLSWATASGGGTVASGCIYLNNLSISSSYTITTGQGAMSVGPITVASGAVLTVASGSRYVVL